MSDIETFLKDILVNELFVECEKGNIHTNLLLQGDLGLDSLGFVELKHHVEKRFNITISDDEFTPEHFATISSLATLISKRYSPCACTQS